MLSKSQQKKLIDYWIYTMSDNYKTMTSLYKNKRYSASLFFGHLVLEKALKKLFVKTTKEHPPRIHNLLRLVELAKINLSEEELDLLSDVNEFNLEARYPEVKYEFYKKCTKLFSDPYYQEIKKIYRKLCQKIKQKK